MNAQIIAALAALAVVAGAFYMGQRYGRAACERAHAEAAIKQRDKIDEALKDAGKEEVARRVSTIRVDRELSNEVSKYLRADGRARAQCFDDDELRLIRAISSRKLPVVQP